MMFPEEPPLVIPVHNLGAGGNTPPYWLEPPQGLGWKYAMFNAYFLRNVERIPYPVKAWIDSGAFLFIETYQRELAGTHGKRRLGTRSWSEDLVIEVLKIQERLGAEVAFTLDYPLPPQSQVDECCPDEVLKRMKLTAKAAGIAFQMKTRNIKIFPVLQFNSYENLKVMLALLEAELKSRAGVGLDEVDGLAIGGLVPHSGKWWLVVKRLQELRRLVGWEVRVHLLGVASPQNVPLFFYAGADSMDSKTFIISAAKRLYYLPLGKGRARIELKAELPKDSCNCPVCSNHDLEELREKTKLLTLHNLYVMLDSAKKARELCFSGQLKHFLLAMAKASPRVAKALRFSPKGRRCKDV